MPVKYTPISELPNPLQRDLGRFKDNIDNLINLSREDGKEHGLVTCESKDNNELFTPGQCTGNLGECQITKTCGPDADHIGIIHTHVTHVFGRKDGAKLSMDDIQTFLDLIKPPVRLKYLCAVPDTKNTHQKYTVDCVTGSWEPKEFKRYDIELPP
jgi:hypothetical protein